MPVMVREFWERIKESNRRKLRIERECKSGHEDDIAVKNIQEGRMRNRRRREKSHN